jgi:hypothetical protein
MRWHRSNFLSHHDERCGGSGTHYPREFQGSSIPGSRQSRSAPLGKPRAVRSCAEECRPRRFRIRHSSVPRSNGSSAGGRSRVECASRKGRLHTSRGAHLATTEQHPSRAALASFGSHYFLADEYSESTADGPERWHPRHDWPVHGNFADLFLMIAALRTFGGATFGRRQ